MHSKKSHRVSIGYIPIVNCSSIFIATEKGYFKDEGIEVELVSLIGGEKITTALVKGEVDIGFLTLHLPSSALTTGLSLFPS